MLHNTPTQMRETPAEKTTRLVNQAKDALDSIVLEAAKDPNFYGKPSIELGIQGGRLETITVNAHRTHK